jgi:hypothetical protein
MMYLVKWRDLPYSSSTWEHENAEYTDLKSFIDYYWVQFFFSFNKQISSINYFTGLKSIL